MSSHRDGIACEQDHLCQLQRVLRALLSAPWTDSSTACCWKKVMTGLNDPSGFSQELLLPFWISWCIALADLNPGQPLGVTVFTGGPGVGLLMLGGRWGAGNETNSNPEYLFLFLCLFVFSPSLNLFQQLYQILTDFDIRFYMYELLKVSGIAYGSLDVEARNERGSSWVPGVVLLSSYFSRVQCRIHISSPEEA